MVSELDDSYRLARRLTRRSARNFYFSFLTLPRNLRRDMCVLYAYMRQTDDLGDDESLPIEERKSLLQAWELVVRDALEGVTGDAHRQQSLPGIALLPALADIVARHGIPRQSLFDVIDGVRSDLEPRRFATFAELDAYCHLVAGAVGVCCIHIWGFDRERPEALQQAIDTGTAFQLTNILRDLGEDLDRGRLYLPLEDMERFGLEEQSLRASCATAPFRELMAFQVKRAGEYYRRGAMLLPALSPHGRRIQSAMIRIYGGLLDLIEARSYDVFSHRIRLPWSRKLLIAASCIAPWGGCASHR